MLDQLDRKPQELWLEFKEVIEEESEKNLN